MAEDAPRGAIYIAPKAVAEKPPEKWPRFVYVAHQSYHGVAKPEIWYSRRSTGYWENGLPQNQPTLFEHEIREDEFHLFVKGLVFKYPPPAGYKLGASK